MDVLALQNFIGYTCNICLQSEEKMDVYALQNFIDILVI